MVVVDVQISRSNSVPFSPFRSLLGIYLHHVQYKHKNYKNHSVHVDNSIKGTLERIIYEITQIYEISSD
jgi:hypothetical protein